MTDDVLSALRDAWNALNSAQRTIARLTSGKYAGRPTPGMKHDLNRAYDREAAARTTLNKILGAPR